MILDPAAGLVANILAGFALAGLALVFQNRVAGHERHLLLIPGVILLAFLVLTLYVLVWDTDPVLPHHRKAALAPAPDARQAGEGM